MLCKVAELNFILFSINGRVQCEIIQCIITVFVARGRGMCVTNQWLEEEGGG